MRYGMPLKWQIIFRSISKKNYMCLFGKVVCEYHFPKLFVTAGSQSMCLSGDLATVYNSGVYLLALAVTL